MKPSVTTRWLVAQILVITALTQVGVKYMLPAALPEFTSVLGGGFPAMAGWAIAVGLILWRVCVAMGATPAKDVEGLGGWRVSIHAAVVFIAGLVCTGIAVLGQIDYTDREVEDRFERASDQIVGLVKQRFGAVSSGLRSVQGLYGASEQVRRREFNHFVAGLDLVREHPGVLGFGFVQRVPREQLDAFIAAERADDAPDFALKLPAPEVPAGGERPAKPDLYVVKYVEPLDGNRGAWGLDMGADAARRETAQHAAATGEPTLSERVQLKYFGHKYPGYLMMLAVYRNGVVPATQREREDALVGIAYAPLVVEHALDGIGGPDTIGLDYEVFEGEIPNRSALLFDRDASLSSSALTQSAASSPLRVLASQARLLVGGRPITVLTSAGPAFVATRDQRAAALLGAGGMVTTLLLSGIVWSLGASRHRALALARGATDDLKVANASAERLAEIARRTSNRVIIVDRFGKIEWVNDGFTRNSGYTLAEVEGRRPEDFLMGPLTDRVSVQVLRNAMERHERASVEIYNYSKDGRACLIAIELMPLRDVSGELTGFMAVESDITARRQVEQALAASERRMRSIFEAEPEGVIVVATDGELVELNAAGLAMMEAASVAELRSFGLAKVVTSECHGAFNGLLEAARQGNACKGEFEIVGLCGTHRWLDAHAVPLRGDDASVTGVLAVTRDITARKQTQVRDLANLELSSRLVAADDVLEVADAVLNRLAAADLAVARAAVLVFADDGICRFVSYRGLTSEYCRAVEGHCPWKQGAMDATPIVVEDTQADPDLAPYRELFARECIGSLAFIPLTTDQGVVGKIMLYADQAGGLCQPQCDGAKAVAAIAGMSVARIVATGKLERSEERTRLVIDTALDAVVAMDQEGVVTQWNAQAERTFGWSAPEAIGVPLTKLIFSGQLSDDYAQRLVQLRHLGPASLDARR
ncbi:MAG: PAS domain S-box protein, partial [Planctomycetota bacterium]|nr:PAS domain S-box protein [Planctomycetota bacterium]